MNTDTILQREVRLRLGLTPAIAISQGGEGTVTTEAIGVEAEQVRVIDCYLRIVVDVLCHALYFLVSYTDEPVHYDKFTGLHTRKFCTMQRFIYSSSLLANLHRYAFRRFIRC